MMNAGFNAGFTVGVAAAALAALARCTFRVDQGHCAILVTFGRAEFREDSKHLLKIWGPGLHFKWPWQRVHSVSMMEQSLDLSGKDGGISAMASDGTILRLDSKLRYTPIEDELYDFLFAMRDPVEHIKGLFTCLLRNEIANFKSVTAGVSEAQTGSYSVIRGERKLLNRHIDRFTQEKMGGRYGVRFDAVDLTDILPPDELANALNAVITAHTEANTAYARAEGECQSRVLSSKRGVLIARGHAEAAATEIRTLATFLKDLKSRGSLQNYVERRRAEKAYESKTVYVRVPS